MVDEATALQTPSSATSRRLRRAKARALAKDPARHAEASATYRALLEAFANEDDRREYESFIESRDAEERRWKRRWLYQWRARHDRRPAEALLAWAKDEEQHGEIEEAAAIYRNALEVADEAERPGIALKVAGLLEELGHPEDAAGCLAPLLAIVPPMKAAHEIARLMLANRRSGAAVAERFEGAANAADHDDAARIFAFLVEEAREDTAAMPDARRRWARRAVELAHGSAVLGLPALLETIAEMPDEVVLWEAAERLGRELGDLGPVVRAYADTLKKAELDPKLVESLGRRLVTLEAECVVDATLFVEALERVLEIAPRARWALDRVKIALGAQGKWDALFRLYDRAIAAADGERERVELLDEAAICARDLAMDADRAIGYYASIHAVRPEDDATAVALERLYERQGKKLELIELLRRRVPRLEGLARRDAQRRIVVLWLDLGKAQEAGASLEAMLDDGAPVADVADLLERVARHRGQARAIDRLWAHYESLGRHKDVVRIAKISLDLAADPGERAKRIRELVRFRIASAQGAPGVFANAIQEVESDVAGYPTLAKIAYRAVLVRAISAIKKAPTDAEFEDALEGAHRALAALKTTFLEEGDAPGASRLLERGARLRFDRDRQRALLHEAALLSEQRGDRARTIRLFTEIFQEDGVDAIATALLGRFVELLESAGEHAKLANLWEDQGRHHARAGREAEARACWLRAAQRWERQEAWDRALAAYERGAAHGAEAAYEGLARIHSTRGGWDKALPALEWLCTHGAAESRPRYALRLGEVLVELGQTARARVRFEEVLGDSPPVEIARAVRARLIALYRKDGMSRKLVETLTAEAAVSEDRAARAALLSEASSVLHEKLGDSAAAVEALDKAVAASPDDFSLRPKLADLLEGLEKWERLVEVLSQQTALYGERRSKERALVHHRIARALMRLNRSADALAQLELAAKMHPTHPEILHDLAQVSREANDLDLAERTYRALLLALKHPTEPSGALSYTRIFLDLGAISLRKGDAARAANLLESGLEAAFEKGEDSRPFEQALREIGRYDVVARAIEWRISRAPNEATRAGEVRDLADLWRERLGEDAELGTRIRKYAETIRRALEADVKASDEAWTSLWSVYVSLADERTLLEIIGRRLDALKAASAAEQARAKAWLLEAASLCSKNDDSKLAAKVLDRILSSALDIQPTDAEAKDLVGVARALERVGRLEDATRLYESILDNGPSEPETVRTLADRLEALGSAKLADCLELWIAVDAASAREVAPKLIALREQQGDDASLIRALELGLKVDPTNTKFLERLVQCHEEEWDWAAVTRALRRWLDAAPDDRAVLRRLVQAYRTAGTEIESVRLLDAVLAKHPGDAELLCLRARARAGVGDYEGAVVDLRSVGDVDAAQRDTMLEILATIVARAAAPAADEYAVFLVDVLLRAGQGARARRELEELLSRNPLHAGALERWASMEAAEGAWDRAAKAYGTLARVVGERAPVDYAALRRATLLLADACERAGRRADAREPLERALRAIPDADDVARSLERACEAAGDWKRLADLLAARAGRTQDAGEKTKLLVRAADLFIEELGDPASALPLVELARKASPDSVEVGLGLGKVHMALGRPAEALSTLSEIAWRNRAKRSPALASVHFEMAKAHLALDELAEALDALKIAFAMDFRDGDLAMLLGLVALDLGDDKTAERAFMAVATLAPRKQGGGRKPVTAEKASALYHLASLAHDRGEVSKAQRWVVKAISEDPGHQAARALRERIDKTYTTVARGR